MFEDVLRQCPPALWTATRDAILPEVHDVDRAALLIWWLFYPLALSDAYAAADDPAVIERRWRIDGMPRPVGDRIDTSHRFFFGHRYWPAVKIALEERASQPHGGVTVDLTSEVRQLAARAAGANGADVSLTTAIALAGLMTLRQAGLAAFRASRGQAASAPLCSGAAPAEIIARRQRDDRQGLGRFLRTGNRYTVVFDERDADSHFPIFENQHLTTAAALDSRDYTRGPRRFHEGPIPAQCRSATCGTCWVGVIGGRDKLSDIEPHEAGRLRAFGYIDPQLPRPLIRLACQARAFGNATIVIPPWNGVVARLYADGELPQSGAPSLRSS